MKRLTKVSGINMNVFYISTHSLMKRLTIIRFFQHNVQCYFNSQPHEEADIYNRKRLSENRYFNSQPHEEADDFSFCSFVSSVVISTHSLMKRLTFTANTSSGENVYFNSQPHEEADLDASNTAAGKTISTHSLMKRLTASLDKNIFIQN